MLTQVRGLGQGALSIVSMAMIGKWFTRRLPMAMGVFTVLLAIGFIIGNFAVGAPVQTYGWRPAWFGVGLFLVLGLAPIGALLVRSTPEAMGVAVEGQPAGRPMSDMSLGQALCCPGFWAFTLGASLFNLTWSAITLFQQSILEERNFDPDTFLMVMGLLVVSGLPANLISGWLAQRWPMGRLLCVGMLLLAGSLLAFPLLETTWHVAVYAVTLGVAGGIITVVFFAVYGHAFGRRHLGAIQATVQIVSVLASALGPVLLRLANDEYHSYMPFFHATATAAIVLGLLAWLVALPGETRSF
jgi:MFS family permease